MKHPETRLQIAVATYLRKCLGPGTAWRHIPNGGARNYIEGAILKASGVHAGDPDVEIIWQGRAFAIELKAGKGRISEAQRHRHAELVSAGCPVAVCWDLDQVRSKLAEWQIPTREIRASTEAIVRGLKAAITAQ